MQKNNKLKINAQHDNIPVTEEQKCLLHFINNNAASKKGSNSSKCRKNKRDNQNQKTELDIRMRNKLSLKSRKTSILNPRRLYKLVYLTLVENEMAS